MHDFFKSQSGASRLTRKQVWLSQKSIGLTPNPASGILCTQAHGKLCFCPPETFLADKNHLPRKRKWTRSEVVRLLGYSQYFQAINIVLPRNFKKSKKLSMRGILAHNYIIFAKIFNL